MLLYVTPNDLKFLETYLPVSNKITALSHAVLSCHPENSFITKIYVATPK